jgi:hypothetical protein
MIFFRGSQSAWPLPHCDDAAQNHADSGCQGHQKNNISSVDPHRYLLFIIISAWLPPPVFPAQITVAERGTIF